MRAGGIGKGSCKLRRGHSYVVLEIDGLWPDRSTGRRSGCYRDNTVGRSTGWLIEGDGGNTSVRSRERALRLFPEFIEGALKNPFQFLIHGLHDKLTVNYLT